VNKLIPYVKNIKRRGMYMYRHDYIHVSESAPLIAPKLLIEYAFEK